MCEDATLAVCENADGANGAHLSMTEMIENIVPYITDWVFECNGGQPVPPEDFVQQASWLVARAMIEQHRYTQGMWVDILNEHDHGSSPRPGRGKPRLKLVEHPATTI
jgi:hypothetical protein